MSELVNKKGLIDFGLYDNPIDSINYLDYNLESPLGRKVSLLMKRLLFKQFNFFGILSPEITVGLAVIDIKYLTSGFFYIHDRTEGSITETSSKAPFFKGRIKATPSSIDSSYSTGKLKIALKNSTVFAEGKDISLQVELDFKNVNPLRICTRSGYRGWTYTEKITPIGVKGQVVCKGKTWNISSPEAMSIIDWSAGFMRRKTYWNWAATAATLPDGRSFGLNCACGTNETGFTENAFWLNNEITKTDTVNFLFDVNDLMKPWRVVSYDKKIDLEFQPEITRSDKTNALLLATRFSQISGHFSGTVHTDKNESVTIRKTPGYVEDHYVLW